jgi:peroxin-19
MRGAVNEEREEDDQLKDVFKAAWEAMLVEGMDGKATEEEIAGLGNDRGSEPRADAGSSSSAASTGEPKRNDFQERLKQAMNKMKEAESNLQAGSRSGGSEDAVNPESLEELLKNMSMEGEGSEEELADFLENIMGQLMSKEVLYDPLKELADK